MEMPQIHDRFQLLEQLEDSEAQLLFRATDKLLEREVLLKLPSKAMAQQIGSAADQKRSLREARMLAKVKHGGIAQLLDIIELPRSEALVNSIGIPGGPMLVLEAVAGESLAERLIQGPMSADEVRSLARSLCDSLSAVHEVGVVHRGLSGESVVIRPDGSPCLGGFSFAKQASMVGTSSICYRPKTDGGEQGAALPAYPAPEQLSGQPADARSDLYGLGSLMFRCLTGEDLSDSQDMDDLAASIRSHSPDVPKGLIEVIRKSLSRSPMGRYPTAREMGEALDASLTVSSGGGRGRMPVLVGVASAAAALALSMVFWMGGEDGSPFGQAGTNEEFNRGRPKLQAVGALTNSYDKTHALLIGVQDTYDGREWDKLNNTLRDVQEVRDTLVDDLGWGADSVTMLTEGEANEAGIRRALSKIEESAGINDRVLVYFAGHGKRNERNDSDGWIVPSGATEASQYINMNDLLTFMRSCDAKHIMLALDCCFAGRVVADMGLARGSLDLKSESHLIMTSVGGNRVAMDGQKGKLSPFAAAFTKALREECKDEDGHFQKAGANHIVANIQRELDRKGIDQSPMLRPVKGEGTFLFSLPK
ncbi:MAG: protein kinase domain-containing protein [Planctomycetota bacterium]|jgi:tRNA A-37 threonylcarbamoyl transferase component Bud32